MPIKSWGDLLNDAGGAGDSFDPLPTGDYDFEVTQADVKQTQNGKTMYSIRAKVESGPHANRLVFHNFVVSPENPNALALFFRQLNILGLNRDFFAQNPSDHHVAEALVGRRFRGQVTIKTWQGQDRNEIKQFYGATSNALGNGQPVPGPTAPTPQAPPAAPAPTPAPAYSAPPAPAPPAPPQAAPAPPPPPVQQPATPEVQTPAAPPVSQTPPPPPAPPSPAAGGDVPAPPPF